MDHDAATDIDSEYTGSKEDIPYSYIDRQKKIEARRMTVRECDE